MNRATAYTKAATVISQPHATQPVAASDSRNAPVAAQRSRSQPVARRSPATDAPRKPLQRAESATGEGGVGGVDQDRFRLQVKEELGRLLPGREEREKFAELAQVPYYRVEHFVAESSDRTIFAHQVPAITLVAGPALLEFLAAQTGHAVDEAAVVELGRVAVEIARLEKRRAELLEEAVA